MTSESLPDEVRADLDTLISAYEKLSSSGDISEAAGAVNSPEFTAASERLSTYFQNSCNG